MPETLERTDTALDTELAHRKGKKAHICANRDEVTEAYVLGNELVALCGYRWIPTTDPQGLPVCEECKEIAMQFGGAPEH